MQGLTHHIKEAITLNKQRLPLYAELTNSKSIQFSKKLINYEKAILLTSWYVDWVGKKFQNAGIPFLKHEFVDIGLANLFSKTFPPGFVFEEKLVPFDKELLFSELIYAVKNNLDKWIISSSNEILSYLDKQPHVYHMTRHIIESIKRIAFLIPLHEKRAKYLSIEAPSQYSYLLLKAHLFLLNGAKTFDEDCAFIHNMGVPFIWQDLPKIKTDNIIY